tara:strand:+ start:13982 stop:14554 length:573 start_codon:yes stop_codon:yes gene_type:complete
VAKPIRKSVNFIRTGKGDYNDISKNLMEILRKDLSQTSNANSIKQQRPLDQYKIEAFKDFDPDGITAEEESNCLYVWCEGSTGMPKEVGQLTKTSHHSIREEFYVNVEYRDWDRNKLEAQSRVRHIGHAIKESVFSHPDLRGFFNGGLSMDGVEISRRTIKTSKSVALAEIVQVRLTYSKLRNIKGRSDR